MKLLVVILLFLSGVSMAVSIEFNGKMYNDDRMYVFYMAPCTEEIEGEYVHYHVFHETPPVEHKWCLVTYRNTQRYPVSRLDAFETKVNTQEYLNRVESTTPLISLNGEQSKKLPNEFSGWKKSQGFKEYDYKKMYLSGGEGYMEMITIKRK